MVAPREQSWKGKVLERTQIAVLAVGQKEKYISEFNKTGPSSPVHDSRI